MFSRNIVFFVLLFCMASFADFSKGISYGDVNKVVHFFQQKNLNS